MILEVIPAEPAPAEPAPAEPAPAEPAPNLRKRIWSITSYFPKSPKAVLFESLGKVPQKGIIAEKP